MPVKLTQEQLALSAGKAKEQLTHEEFKVYWETRFGTSQSEEEAHQQRYHWGDTTDAWEAFGRADTAPKPPPPAAPVPEPAIAELPPEIPPASDAPAAVVPVAKPPRKRGRPAKVVEPEPPPRKRGRPPKKPA